MEINYLAILVCGVLSMVIGSIWYGPLFGKKWMEICGINSADLEARKKMQKESGSLYIVQFVLVLFQVFVLSRFLITLTMWQGVSGWIIVSLIIYSAFIVPMIAGCVMWTAEPTQRKWARFLIQSGYQLVLFIVFAVVLYLWN